MGNQPWPQFQNGIRERSIGGFQNFSNCPESPAGHRQTFFLEGGGGGGEGQGSTDVLLRGVDDDPDFLLLVICDIELLLGVHPLFLLCPFDILHPWPRVCNPPPRHLFSCL